MMELYWICFIGGAAFTVLLLFFDTVLGGWLDGVLDVLPDAFQPICLVGGVVAFGGAGILLSEYSSLNAWSIFALSLLAAACLSVMLMFVYVKPMKRAENSVAYSVQEIPGKIGEVSVPIPVGGFGEVGFTFGHGFVYEIAKSTEQDEIAAGEKVLAIEVKDRVITVCRWTEMM